MRHPKTKVAIGFVVGVIAGASLLAGGALMMLWAAENVW